MAGKKREGKNGRLQVNGVNLNLTKWTIDDNAPIHDATDFEDAGVKTSLTGVEHVKVTGSGYWDAGQNAFDAAVGLYPRADLANVKLYENVADNVFWSFTTFTVGSCKQDCGVDGLVTFSFDGESNGTITRPTGSK